MIYIVYTSVIILIFSIIKIMIARGISFDKETKLLTQQKEPKTWKEIKIWVIVFFSSLGALIVANAFVGFS